jgi:hypothetical protein
MSVGRTAFITATLLLIAVPRAHAQVGSATLKGHITAGTAAAASGTEVIATNTANGFSYRTLTKADGSYVLTGLAPGSYQISVAGTDSKQPITLAVGETASLDFETAAAAQEEQTIAEVTVTGSILRKDVKTSEVGTAISPELIDSLPQASRNFLAFADLAPGVRFTTSPNTGQVSLSGGAQNRDNVNIFIDGVGQKNYVLRGGIAGMDSTRGNPFPQSAISEYRVITQNYKAEYDQVSSAAITAVTRSGTNEFDGDVFFDRVDDSWVAKDPFQKDAESQGIKRPPFHEDEYGFSFGGPIIRDRLHFFVAYEGKDIVQPRQVVLQNDNLLPDAGIVPDLRALAGSTDQKFKEDLILGKIDAQLTDTNKLEFTTRLRRESDFVPEDTLLSSPGNEKDRKNDETRFDLKLATTLGDWLNEARLGHQDTVWNPHSRSGDPAIKYFVSPSNTTDNILAVLETGGSPDAQNRAQKGWQLQDDLTFTGLAGHTFKMGVKANFLKFNLSGTAFSVPYQELLIDNTTGEIIAQLRSEAALPGSAVDLSDKQYGIYFQDDWEVTPRLELNLGIRWDYETNMLNDGYVMPADRVAALLAEDVTRYGITPPAGQTYAESLALGGVNVQDYIADGNSRKPFKKAFQPRLGFSYDLSGNKGTVLFGGAGRAYDRALANYALDELQKNTQANGEIWGIRNKHKNPYTDQVTLGVRQAVADWNTEAGVIGTYAYHQFNWFGGNRDPGGGFDSVSPIDPLFAGPHVPGGPPDQFYGTLVLGDFITKTMTRSAYLKADKPFNREEGWGVTATYTYSNGRTTHRAWTADELFNWTYGKPGQAGYHPSIDVEKHRLVLTAITSRIPFGFMVAGKATFGSGLPLQATDCSLGFDQCVYRLFKTDHFRQIDLALSKDINVRYAHLNVRADVLNIFNTVNYGGYDTFGGGPGNPQNDLGGDNANYGVPNGMQGPMRTLKLTFAATF